jgi:NADH:ubiquinone reductase (H+-translocating)
MKEKIERLLHVVVVGAGPTGYELAGALHDFIEKDLKNQFPLLASHIKVSLVDPAMALNGFKQTLRVHAEKILASTTYTQHHHAVRDWILYMMYIMIIIIVKK